MGKLVLILAAVFSVDLHAQQYDQTVQLLNQITDAQKEMKKLSAPGPDACWDCDLKDRKICSFADICKIVNARSDSKNVYQKADGTYIPNYGLASLNDYLNTCRQQFSQLVNYMPESFEKNRAAYNQKNKKFYETIKIHNDQKAFVDISQAMIDLPVSAGAGGGLGSPTDFIKTLEAAEKRSGVTLKTEVKEAWKDLVTNSSSMITALPESLGNEGLLNFNNLYSAQPPLTTLDDVRANQKEYTKNLNRVNEIMTRSKERILAVLERKKTFGNVDQIEAMKKRIETIKLSSAPQQFYCTTPQAYYSPNTHSFVICPNISMMPDDALAFIIAHEMSHSIDPCATTQDLVRVSVDPSILSPPLATAFDKEKYPNFLPFDYRAKDSDSAHIYRHEKSDLSNVGADIFSKRIAPSQFPFNKTLDCLAGGSSVGARRGNANKKIAGLEAELKELEDSGGQSSRKAVILRNQIEESKKSVEENTADRCMESGSQLQEAFSDWLAVESLAEEFKTEGEASRKVFEMAGIMYGFCHKDYAPSTVQAVQKCSASFPPKSDEANQEDEHPFVSQRINRILLMHPKIRAMLGCANDQRGNFCD